uniref:Uncharacterized protein n=1 Tax=Arundo donax TaxID=35708 RepID=A0A0A9BFG5_ARUDO
MDCIFVSIGYCIFYFYACV